MSNTLGLPEDQLLHTINKNLPFVFLVDEALVFTNRIMKPYSGMHEKGKPPTLSAPSPPMVAEG
nr:unnamed protein product [Callosobruchus analis]